MQSEKIFYIKELYFNLPCNFEGSKLDALRLLVEYREQQEKRNNINIDYDKTIDHLEILWNNEKIKCAMESSIGEYNFNKREWEYR